MKHADLLEHKYVTLTSYDEDGTPVVTPEFVVPDRGHLLLVGFAGADRTFRVRQRAEVGVTACTARGRAVGPAVPGTARLRDDVTTSDVRSRLIRRYGIVADAVTRGAGQLVAIEIHLAA